MKLGKTLLEERAPGEVKYYASAKSIAVLGPQLGELVPQPYGAFSLETIQAHGGWIGSAEDLVRFGVAFNRPTKCKILSEKSITDMFARPEGAPGRAAPGRLSAAYYGCGWYVRPIGRSGQLNTWHPGTLPGSASLLVRRLDGLTWAVLFNSRDGENGAKVTDEIDPLLHEAANVYLLAGK
jgi:CubicO group peptidase (beta-lactamase class C family)